MANEANIPNTNQKTVRAYMKVKSFISPDNLSAEKIEKFDQEVIDFLSTIDNVKRFLNGRNSYSVGNKLYVLIWYLESIEEQPISQPFGGSIKENINEQDNSSTETTTK
jgi:F0F1-type ATP synthase beta subunit